MNNQLRNFDRAVMKTMSIKELKENAKGIQVQGKLELRGQTTIKAFRDAVSSRISSDKLDEKISNLIDKMATDKKNAFIYHASKVSQKLRISFHTLHLIIKESIIVLVQSFHMFLKKSFS